MSKNQLQYLIIGSGFIFFLLFLIKFFDISYPLTITTTTKSTELSVVGEGKIDVVPDTAYVDVGITVDNVTTVIEAQNKINETNNKIITAMKKLGINKNDIKTSNYSIYPNYIYEGSRNTINGYNGNVTIAIKVKNINQTTNVITEATKAGANQVQGTRFVIDKPENYRVKVRELAIANAKDQAQKLANSLGIKLGKISNIVELSPSNDIIQPLYSGKAMSEGIGGVAPQIEPGSQTLTSVVTLYFEKK